MISFILNMIKTNDVIFSYEEKTFIGITSDNQEGREKSITRRVQMEKSHESKM
jgi:hypothetical protein